MSIRLTKTSFASREGSPEGTPRLEPNGLVVASGESRAILSPSEDTPMGVERAGETQELQVSHHHL